MNPTRILLVGGAGRMGTAISAIARTTSDFVISGSVEQGDAIEKSIGDCDAVVDFSQADAVATICAACVASGKPLVSGTTGHSEEQLEIIARAAKSIPLLIAPNFSIGVNALFWLTRKAAELLGSDFDLEIVEHHHRLKKDAPSGTAKRLAEILCESRGLDCEDLVHGRKGISGERAANEIGIHSVRGGDVVGDHTVIFAGRGERLELSHKSSSRETFAAGALRAARWIVGKPPGRYSMEDVLDLAAGE